MKFKRQFTQYEKEIIEKELEDLSLTMLKILKESRDKGLIGEDEYKAHIKTKECYLDFLRKKKNTLFAI